MKSVSSVLMFLVCFVFVSLAVPAARADSPDPNEFKAFQGEWGDTLAVTWDNRIESSRTIKMIISNIKEGKCSVHLALGRLFAGSKARSWAESQEDPVGEFAYRTNGTVVSFKTKSGKSFEFLMRSDGKLEMTPLKLDDMTMNAVLRKKK